MISRCRMPVTELNSKGTDEIFAFSSNPLLSLGLKKKNL